MKIGVFDSGIGGKSIADRLTVDYPSATIIYVDDRKNVPYGSRSQEEIIRLTDAAIQPLFEEGCDAIVLACNTATAAAIEFLRKKYPKMPFIGLEPMVKTAAGLTHTNVVAICATPATLASVRYARLKNKFAADIKVIEPDCSNWASMIENDWLNEESVVAVIDDACQEGADVIVLACTHYHWIKDTIVTAANGRAVVIDPSEAISRRVGVVLGI